MSTPQVSVIIPAYNSEKTIQSTIKAVLDQGYPLKSVVVVDDGSTDKTAEIIKAFKEIKYVSQLNAGPATARNRGADVAEGDYLFFTDSDCIPHKDWIESAMKNFNDESIAVVSGSYGIANKENILARCVYKEILYRHKNLLPKNPKVFGSYNFGVRKKIFQEVGGFDSAYFHASGEDNNLSYKIHQRGYRIYFESKSLVDHFHPAKISKYLTEQYRHGYWRAKMYKDHPKMIKGDDYTFWKDMIEVPITFVIALGVPLNIIWQGVWSGPVIFLLLILYFLQIIFGLLITKNIFETIFYSCVTFLRAFFRMFGLSSGILSLFFNNNMKKI